MAQRRSYRRGFSILELAVVNVTIGILMTVAMPRLSRALNRARVVEALTTASTIERMLLDYYNRTGQYPPGGGEQNPPQPVSAGRATWDANVSGWDAIGFKADGSKYNYRYTFTTEVDPSTGRYTIATIRAWSDVDRNGIEGEYVISLQDGARIKDELVDE